MRFTRSVLVASALVATMALLPTGLAGQADRKLQVSFNSGNVTVIARNVTLREILAEWARQGGCQFVNIDKLSGGVLPALQFENEPELVVLSSLLGPVSGYIVGGRRVGTQGASQFEAVYVVPTSHPTSVGYAGSGPVAAPLMSPTMPDDEIPPVTPIPNMQNGSGGQAPANSGNAPAGAGSTMGSSGAGGVPGTGVLVPPTGGRSTVPAPGTPGGPGRGGRGGGGR